MVYATLSILDPRKACYLRLCYPSAPHELSSGYMVMDYVEDGQMLSDAWDTIYDDTNKRLDLYRDLSRIMLSLAGTQLSRIGSLTMDNRRLVSLTNRPLELHLHKFENDEIPTGIPRDTMYTTTETYLLDRLSSYDNRIRRQPNSILDQSDGASQLPTLTIMRALIPHYTRKETRHGPFPLMLTDLHPSNIFVREDGHVACIIDLEWACTRPAEMLQPPHWLTNRSIDQITGHHLVEYGERHKEFVSALRAEEEASGCVTSFSAAMSSAWDHGGFWYFNSIESFSGLYSLFLQHVQPTYGVEASRDWKGFERSVTPYWVIGTTKFIESKVREREDYLQRLREVFERASEGDGTGM